jgi:Family of unknown function (DUF6263)
MQIIYMKRVSFLITLLATVLILAGLQSCQSTKSATATKMLKFNFENGKGYDYEMSMTMDQEMMGQPMKMDMLYYYSMDVSADDGTMKTITTHIDRVKMNMNIAGLDIKVDSDKKAGDGNNDEKNPMEMVNRIFGAISGKKFVMKVNQEGKIEELTGINEMANAIADSMHLEGKDRQEMMAKFNQQFNEKGMKGQFERVLYIFPNKEVKVGDSWTKSTAVTGQMGGKYTSTYKVKDIEGDMVTLEEKSKIESETEGMGMDGKVTGLLVIDSRSGLMVNADQDMVINVDKGGMKITMNAKNKVKGKAR